MHGINFLNAEESGFSFRNCRRNDNLIKNGFNPKDTTKTGTTIVGVVIKDGVIIGADTRATSGGIVVDKECQKIYYIQNNIYCCGAGTAADMQQTSVFISANMELIRQNSGRKSIPVRAAMTFAKQYLRRFMGRISAHLIIGGVDNDGAHIYSVHPHGSSDYLPYATMGSGSLAAMTVFETRWKPDMTEEEGMKLARDAIAAGIMNDLGSGSNVDLCIIRKGSSKLIRGYDIVCERQQRKCDYTPQRGATGVLSCHKFELDVVKEEIESTME